MIDLIIGGVLRLVTDPDLSGASKFISGAMNSAVASIKIW